MMLKRFFIPRVLFSVVCNAIFTGSLHAQAVPDVVYFQGQARYIYPENNTSSYQPYDYAAQNNSTQQYNQYDYAPQRNTTQQYSQYNYTPQTTAAPTINYETLSPYDAEQAYQTSIRSAPAASRVERQRVYDPANNQRLMDATRAGRLNDIRWLLTNGANPKYTEPGSGATPLYLAVKSGWVQLAQLFREFGADLVSPNETGTTYLHVVAASGKLAMAQYLVSIGANPNAVTNKGWTPLHHAARFGHTNIVNYLLSLNVDANRFTSDGFSALGLASHARQYQSASLLENYANVPARINRGYSVPTRLTVVNNRSTVTASPSMAQREVSTRRSRLRARSGR